MSGTTELEQRAAELRKITSAPSPAAELAEVEREIAAVQAQEARTAAEKWLLDNVRAIGGAYSELKRTLDRIRENPNAKDVAKANEMWDKIRERLAWAFLVERRLPGVRVPNAPTPTAPGFQVGGVAGLSVESWRRPIHPAIVAWWSPEVRERAFEAAAAEWVTGNAATLPDDLRAILEAAPPVSFVEPADPVKSNEAAVLARVPTSRLGHAVR